VIQHLSEMTLFLNYCIFSGGAEALVRCGGKLQHLLIAYFLGNMCAKHYENPTMLSRVIAINVGDVFFETHCSSCPLTSNDLEVAMISFYTTAQKCCFVK